jgi:hypothetical protein
LNNGLKKQDKGVKAFTEGETNFSIAYELKRPALVLRFERAVCAQETHYLSLVSTLDRTIKDTYGLDEGELKVLVDPQPVSPVEDDKKYIYVLFYDATGSGNVPLEKVYADFNTVLGQAYQKLKSCLGSEHTGCESGCYACLKSYALHFYAHLVDKPTAVMFTGYLLGKNPYLPSMLPLETPPSHFDLTFDITISGSEIRLNLKEEYTVQTGSESQNKAIFDLLIKAIQTEFRENMTGLLIRARQEYLVNAINRNEINTDKDDFARLQFNMLRFKHVLAQGLD